MLSIGNKYISFPDGLERTVPLEFIGQIIKKKSSKRKHIYAC